MKEIDIAALAHISWQEMLRLMEAHRLLGLRGVRDENSGGRGRVGILFCVEWAFFLGSSGHLFCVKHHWGAVRWSPPEGFQRGRVGILRVLRLGLQMKSRTFVSRRVVPIEPPKP